MNTCSTCKWWNPPAMFRDGLGAVLCHELGECMSPMLRIEYCAHTPDEAQSSQDEDACISKHAQLRCGPKFGCVKHRMKK